jgi:predicted CXXCH cytochrome family protein
MRRTKWLARAVLIPGLAFVSSSAPLPTSGQPDNGYINAAVCASCHPKQAEMYRRTGMGRSFYKPDPSNQIENYARGLPYYHAPSATYYSMAVREGRYYQSQYQIGFDGNKTNFLEKQIDYVVGSGNHARTYLSRTPRNQLIELPLAWYAENGGYWAMNPGYDRPDHQGFNRHIEYNCLFCHNAYPFLEGSALPSAPALGGSEAIFPARLPESIDCQRCHGPGRLHVQAAQSHEGKNIQATIVNPARLAPARRIEVCLQCHLETTSFPLPNALVRYERGPFSYRPGEPLADFRLEFDRAPGSGYASDFEIAGSAYQLEESACLRKSGGRLSCTTCHNPHDVRHGPEAEQQYNAICRGCHSARLGRLIAAAGHTVSANCIGCHMPKRRTDDAVHVVMTDHRILRIQPAGDLLAGIRERQHDGGDAYRGEVISYRPASLGGAPAKPEDDLYLAAAQVVQESNLQAGIPRLVAAIRTFQPKAAEHYVALGDALRFSNQCVKAIPIYQEALEHGPGETVILQRMGLCLAATGQHAQAEKVLGEALKRDPDNPKLWTQFGLSLVAQGRAPEAITAFENATATDPDLFEAWNNLGEIRLQNGDATGAELALRSALRGQPNSASAHENLGNLLSASNRFEEAKYEFEAALRYRPDDASIHFAYARALARVRRYLEARAQLEESLAHDASNAEAHHALGLVLDAQGDGSRAIDEYREAVKLQPAYGLANLSLGWALVKSGKAAEALPYLKSASESAEPPVRERARRLLDQYYKN